jgi:23S rRNA (cytosine1962-C5)-methyltransferase
MYGTTLVLQDYSTHTAEGESLVQDALTYLRDHPLVSPRIHTALVKKRSSKSQEERRGRVLFGAKPDGRIREHSIWYALDLTMNRDASFYLDTRQLRNWIIGNAREKRVLNAFAYTGSLGVAAMAGGASRVVQLDLNRRFLNLAKSSYTLNGFPIRKSDFISADFFIAISRLKSAGERFDLAIIDPPFFSTTPKGRVDQVNDSARLMNKVRPLVEHGGLLVAINNALYVSGAEYMRTLDSLCVDGYLRLRELIPVPEDFTGYPETRTGNPITDPAPFNHSTKIAVLEVRHKPG